MAVPLGGSISSAFHSLPDLSADRSTPVSKALATMIIEDLSPASAACSRYLKPFILVPALSCQPHRTETVTNRALKRNSAEKRLSKQRGYLQHHVWQDVMGQLQAALPQGHDGLQLPAQRRSLQVEHGRVLVPLLVLLTETAGFMVPHHRQVDLGRRGVVFSLAETSL